MEYLDIWSLRKYRMILCRVPWLDDKNPEHRHRKEDLLRLLDLPAAIILCKTPQRDMSVLPIDPPMTLGYLLNLMKAYISTRDVLLEVMDSGEEAFVFRFIDLEAFDGSTTRLFVKAKFGEVRKTLVLFAVHPDRRW